MENIAGPSNNNDPVDVVIFDLETSGLGNNAEILQIAARNDEKSFNIYITPTRPIPTPVSAVNHLTSLNGELFYQGSIVTSRLLSSALEEFYNFLNSIGLKCILVAHNCHRFDERHLLRAIRQSNMLGSFEEVIAGFSDTLPIIRNILNRNSGNSLVSLAIEFLDDDYEEEAHNAIQDVLILKSLVEHFDIRNQLIERKRSLNEALARLP